jgi:hypothetical protein
MAASLPPHGRRTAVQPTRTEQRSKDLRRPSGRACAGSARLVGDDGHMDPKFVKIVALVLVVCLVGMTFLGLLFF